MRAHRREGTEARRRRVVQARRNSNWSQAIRRNSPRRDSRTANSIAASRTESAGTRSASRAHRRHSTIPLARTPARFLPPLDADGGRKAQPRRHGSREDERPALPPEREPGVPRREQEVPKTARDGLRRPLLLAARDQGAACVRTRSWYP